MAERLTKAGIPWEYESAPFEIISPSTTSIGVCKLSRGKYTLRPAVIRPTVYIPDFVDPSRKWFIEVKGMETPEFKLKFKLFLRLLKEQERYVEIYMPKNRKQVDETVRLILERP